MAERTVTMPADPAAALTIRFRTPHGAQRQHQANVSDQGLAYIMRHGVRVHRTGIVFVILRRRDIPRADRSQDACVNLAGATLLVSLDGALISVYRHEAATRRVARKPKHRCPDRWPTPAERRAQQAG